MYIRLFLGMLLTSILVALPAAVHARTAQSSNTPTILSRAQWGADESWGVRAASENTDDTTLTDTLLNANKQKLSAKQKKCREAVEKHPDDFAIEHTETHDADGNPYVWARRYSKQVKAIFVHHTGETQTKEHQTKTGIERMQDIYKSHTQGRGWGDIGYHYFIDKQGVIYEGRAGGPKVVGAHVYCANTSTTSIALDGNFQRSYPTEEQLRSLRWLIADLSDRYDIDPLGSISFQGKKMPTVMGHRHYGATVCPGRWLHSLLVTIRTLVAKGDFTSKIVPASSKLIQRTSTASHYRQGLLPVGDTTLRIPPGGAARLSMNYQTPDVSVEAGQHIGFVKRSNRRIGLWQHRGNRRVRVRDHVIAPTDIRRSKKMILQFTILAPPDPGLYLLTIDDTVYRIEVEGRRAR